jgi:hypothetical protein
MRVHAGSKFGFGAFAPLAMAIEMEEHLHKLMFSDSDWNRIVRSSMHELGSWFATERVPLRPTEYATTHLGYPGKKYNRKSFMAAALADGTVQRICNRDFGGWNPWRDGTSKIPGPIWQQWLRIGKASGRYVFSRTGEFKTAKRDFRAHVKARVRMALQERIDGEFTDAGEVPLVHSGELRDGLGGTVVTATATSSSAKTHISIPSPHARVHPKVDAVMRRINPQEIIEGARVLSQRMNELINGASSRTVTRGKNAGKTIRRLTPQQREGIAHTLQKQRGGIASATTR